MFSKRVTVADGCRLPSPWHCLASVSFLFGFSVGGKSESSSSGVVEGRYHLHEYLNVWVRCIELSVPWGTRLYRHLWDAFNLS